MTALAGLWAFGGAAKVEASAASMVEAQRVYGPHDQAVSAIGEAAFGRALYRLLPEDRFDRQPLVDESGRWMLAADIRIDNRDELLDWLGQRSAAELSDSEILFRVWLREGEAALDRILGDFAFAIWDAREQSLVLARDPAGQRPLHYHRSGGLIAFASMPQGLHAIPEIPRRLDESQLAAFVADIRRDGTTTFFEGVQRVAPGQQLTIRRDHLASRQYWQLPLREIRYPNEADYIEAFREQLDRATRARLRGAETLVGSHLSAGLDSSGVTATAARIVAPTGGRVVAFTSAPRLGFADPIPHPRIGDESGLAAAVAARYDNMEHVIVRSGTMSPLDLLGRDDELFQEPVGHPCNMVWWSAVHDEARARGVNVMLTGEAGNLTTSAGGLAMLSDFVRRGRWLRWLREARAVAGTGPTWRGVLATSFGPWTPEPVWRRLSRLSKDPGVQGSPLLHPAWRPEMAARAARNARSSRPPRNNRRFRWELLQQHEPANFRKGILARWGVDERDPTADRRLAEFCFSVPPDIMFSGGVTRRLARLGLADRLPPEILDAPRGYQYADWYESIDRGGLDRALAGLAAGPASSLLDLATLRDRVDSWPTDGWDQLANIGTYRMAFLMALSAGSFANAMSGGDRAQTALAGEATSG
jgi:asparagine synthase (glutamine-hydrolysing)